MQPMPPIQRYPEYTNASVKTARFDAVALPAAARTPFASAFARRIGVNTGVKTQEETPIEYRKQKRNIAITRPTGELTIF